MKALQEREIHMKIKYMGAFSGNEEDLPRKPHRPGTVQFREPDMKKLALRANVIALVIIAFLLPYWLFKAGSQWMDGVLFWEHWRLLSVPYPTSTSTPSVFGKPLISIQI